MTVLMAVRHRSVTTIFGLQTADLINQPGGIPEPLQAESPNQEEGDRRPMLIIKTAGDHRDVGEMVCHWKEDAALATIRSFLGIGCRMFFSRVKPKGAS